MLMGGDLRAHPGIIAPPTGTLFCSLHTANRNTSLATPWYGWQNIYLRM